MLPMDAARPSIQDGSEARDEVAHACCESEGGSSADSSAMCCCRGSSAESFAQLPMVQVRSAEAKAATRAGMARCGVGRGHGRVSTPEGGLKGQGGKLEGAGGRNSSQWHSVLRSGTSGAARSSQWHKRYGEASWAQVTIISLFPLGTRHSSLRPFRDTRQKRCQKKDKK